MRVREVLRKVHWLMSAQFGLDVRKLFRSLIGVPRYLRDLIEFRKNYSGQLTILPCLHDWCEEGGTASGEYFWQDLYVAQKIKHANPDKHVDVGSRIDGFAAHVASFREIEVFDIRPVSSHVPNMVFRQVDLMNSEKVPLQYCDSLSCLHALEHFGLGRYGDPIDCEGHRSGLRNMARMLKPGGVMYLSSPVGEGRVEFNGQRVFNPKDLVGIAAGYGLELSGLALIKPSEALVESVDVCADLDVLESVNYTLGIFTFIKQ